MRQQAWLYLAGRDGYVAAISGLGIPVDYPMRKVLRVEEAACSTSLVLSLILLPVSFLGPSDRVANPADLSKSQIVHDRRILGLFSVQ